MPRETLPGEDQWVDLLEPDQILRKHIRKVRMAMAKGGELGAIVEYGKEAVLTVIITNWTLQQPIPSKADDPLDVLDSLPKATWYALEKIAADYLPNFSDPANAEPPAEGGEPDPPKPSDD